MSTHRFLLLVSVFLLPIAALAETVPVPPYTTRTVLSAAGYGGFAWVGEEVVGWEDGRLVARTLAGRIVRNLGAPPGYRTFNSFVAAEPRGTTIIVGFTTRENDDDRIYRVDALRGGWTLVATVAGNHDAAWDATGSLHISGIAGAAAGRSGVWRIDADGVGRHRLVLSTGGLTSGIAFDAAGALYYAAFEMGGHAVLKRYGARALRDAVAQSRVLTVDDGEALTEVPGNVWDVDVVEDSSGTGQAVVFSANDEELGATLALWTGVAGTDARFIEIARAEDGSTSYYSSLEIKGNVRQRGGRILQGDVYRTGLVLVER